MAWLKKATAPATFSLSQAFLALITGDATWGWLVDWLQLLPQTNYDTVAFCASGPTIAEPLAATDFFPTFNPLDPRQALHTASLAALLTAAARDRVFGAYCENVGELTGGWGAMAEYTVTSGAGGHVEQVVLAPAGATRVRVRFVALSDQSVAGTQFAWAFCDDPLTTTGGGFRAVSGGPVVGTGIGSESDNALGSWEGVWLQAIGAFTAVFGVTWNASTVAPYEPTPQPEPPGLVSPLLPVDPSLDGIAAELARHEFKLDFLQSLVQLLVGGQDYIAGPAEDPVDLVVDTPLAVGDAVGCILTASSIPASRSLDFGDPQNVVKLAHINFGTATAWYPSIWMTHTPMIIRPLPPGTTRVTITDLPPGASVQIALISRQK